MKKIPTVRKILQALYYIQSKAPSDNESRFNRVYLLKMMFMADRYHLRHYGCLATGDSYFAMKLGPVASSTLDILKNNWISVNSAEIGYLSAIEELSEHDVRIGPQGEDEFSKSVEIALDFALKEFGHYNWGELSEISHCYPEWKKHEAAIQTAGRVQMDLRDFFDDPEDEACLARFGKDGDPFKDEKEFLALLKEEFDAHPFSF
jgi:hypothetical protein